MSEQPPTWAYGRIVNTLANWLAAIVNQVAAVVDLLDNGQIHKRKVEMARRGGLTLGYKIGYLAIQRAQINGVFIGAGGPAERKEMLLVDAIDRYCA